MRLRQSGWRWCACTARPMARWTPRLMQWAGILVWLGATLDLMGVAHLGQRAHCRRARFQHRRRLRQHHAGRRARFLGDPAGRLRALHLAALPAARGTAQAPALEARDPRADFHHPALLASAAGVPLRGERGWRGAQQVHRAHRRARRRRRFRLAEHHQQFRLRFDPAIRAAHPRGRCRGNSGGRDRAR